MLCDNPEGLGSNPSQAELGMPVHLFCLSWTLKKNKDCVTLVC